VGDLRTLFQGRFFLLWLIAPLFIVAGFFPVWLSHYTIISLNNIFLYIVLTVNWSLFSGPTGYISLASAAFFGTGIYSAAILGDKLPLAATILSGGLLSFIIALLVGLSSLRLRGMYFTIFTFGLSELIRHAVLWWEVNISGTVGRLVVSLPHHTVFYILLATVFLNLLVVYLIRRSKYGLALRGIGESEEAADHIGVNVNRVKIGIFAVSTFFMGTTGAVMATQWTYIDPSIAFNPLYSFMPVLMAIFGGITKIYGQILGATVLTLLADMLLTKFPYFYNLLYGITLIGVILFLPQGLAGLAVGLKRLNKRRSAA
jgi:branched-chain amino acid transport system permease protein